MKISAWWLYRFLPTIHGASCQISGSPAVRQAQLPIVEIVKQANRHLIVVSLDTRESASRAKAAAGHGQVRYEIASLGQTKPERDPRLRFKTNRIERNPGSQCRHDHTGEIANAIKGIEQRIEPCCRVPLEW